MPKNYVILSDYTEERLSEKVRGHLELGWELLGGVALGQVFERGTMMGVKFYQAMTKD